MNENAADLPVHRMLVAPALGSELLDDAILIDMLFVHAKHPLDVCFLQRTIVNHLAGISWEVVIGDSSYYVPD